MIILLLVIIVVLSLYILCMYHEIHQLHRQIQDKNQQHSHVRILQRHPFLFLNPLISDYNQVFDQLLDSRRTYQQERKMLDQTLHNISHDIRTPLTVSWGYTKQLLKNQPNNHTLQKIDQALANVSKRLEDLLTYQNLLEDNIHPQFIPINLSEAITEHLMQFYDTYTQLGFQVDIQIAPHIWIETDKELLDRILINLLGNIAKHGKDKLSIELITEGAYAKLSFRNHTKQAIKHLDKLTQRFYSEDLSTSEKSSGLGLYITDTLVQLTQGSLMLNYDDSCYQALLTWNTTATPEKFNSQNISS